MDTCTSLVAYLEHHPFVDFMLQLTLIVGLGTVSALLIGFVLVGVRLFRS